MSTLRTPICRTLRSQTSAQRIISSNLRLPLIALSYPVPPTPFPSASRRHISTSFPSFKKAKVQPAKLSKGKVRNQDDPSESDVDVEAVLKKTRAKMSKAVEWAKSQVYEGVERARGRVSPVIRSNVRQAEQPAILDGIRVQLKSSPNSVLLNSIASITVKQNSLFVDVWDASDGASKAVESAIHSANMPGISPQRLSETSIKIPITRPTVEQRNQILKQLGSSIEAGKNQVRTARAEGLKLVGGKGAQGSDDVQTAADGYGGELDELLKTAKKELEK